MESIVKIKRLEKGVTQRAMSLETGIHTTALGRYETRKENPHWEHLQILSAYFDLPISELI